MQTVVHVTHEAIQKIGGIGAVLHGLLTSRVYLDQVPRNILVGPFWPTDESGDQRLGPQGEVLYSSLDSLYRSPLAARFREIEQQYDVGIVYGRRKCAASWRVIPATTRCSTTSCAQRSPRGITSKTCLAIRTATTSTRS